MFHPELVSFLKLLQRSKPSNDGSWKYSRATRNLVLMNQEKFPGLFEVKDDSVSLTKEGKVLMKWMTHVPG